MKLIRRKAVLEKTGIKSTTQWRMERAGLFPARRQISPGLCGWLEEEIDRWIEERQTVTVGSSKPVASGGKRGRKPKTQAAGGERRP